MRVAIVSDMHGNDFGFATAVADLKTQNVGQIVCLGDAIQGGPQPVETVARLRELGCPIVMGNADAWLLSGTETGAEAMTDARRKQLADVRAWQLSLLSPDDLAFIQTFQPTIQLPLE